MLLFAGSPIVAAWTVNGGHNDALVGLGLLGAGLLVEKRRPAWGGLALAGVVLVKSVAGLALLPLASDSRVYFTVLVEVGRVVPAADLVVQVEDHALADVDEEADIDAASG